MTRIPRKLKKMFKSEGLVPRVSSFGMIYGHPANNPYSQFVYPKRYWR